MPGNDAPLVPPSGDVGGYLSPGWAWVVQIHYNLHGPAPADQSSVVMWRGNFFITQVPHDIFVGNTDFTLPPRAETTVEASARVTTKSEYPALNNGWEGRIYAVWGHEHLLGKSVQLDLARRRQRAVPAAHSEVGLSLAEHLPAQIVRLDEGG